MCWDPCQNCAQDHAGVSCLWNNKTYMTQRKTCISIKPGLRTNSYLWWFFILKRKKIQNIYCNILKIGTPLKITLPPFWMKLLQRCFPIYAVVHAVMLMTWRSIEVVLWREGTNEGRHHMLLVYKQVYNKRGIAESLCAYSYRAKLRVWGGCIFKRSTPIREEWV